MANKFVKCLADIVARIFRLKLTDTRKIALEQFIKFCFVGLSNTIVAYITYVVVVFILQKANVLTNVDYYVGNVISWIVGVAWSFYWNNRFVFNEEKREGRAIFAALLKCYASYAFSGLLIQNLLSWLWVDQLGISKYIAPIINLIVTIPLNFLLNKFWAFKKNKA